MFGFCVTLLAMYCLRKNEFERRMCRRAAARELDVPESGESARVSVVDVMDRRVWVPEGVVYIMRDGDEVVYVGITEGSLRARLMNAVYQKKTWTKVGYGSWTVSVERIPDLPYPLWLARERELIQQHNPRYNINGRPKGISVDAQLRHHHPDVEEAWKALNGLPESVKVQCGIYPGISLARAIRRLGDAVQRD
jgi:hypothetical protein